MHTKTITPHVIQPDKINYAGTERIARLMALLTSSLATRQEVPDYRAMAQPERPVGRANVRVYLGTIPDYSQGDVSGLKVAGVIIGGPAAQAGVQGGDVIVELAGKTIENIYDYTYVLNAMQDRRPHDACGAAWTGEAHAHGHTGVA